MDFSRPLNLHLHAHPVVACLVLVVDPVEVFDGAVLDAIFGHPLLCIATALSEDARYHVHLLQVDLDPLGVVLKLGEPRTSKERGRGTYKVWQARFHNGQRELVKGNGELIAVPT